MSLYQSFIVHYDLSYHISYFYFHLFPSLSVKCSSHHLIYIFMHPSHSSFTPFSHLFPYLSLTSCLIHFIFPSIASCCSSLSSFAVTVSSLSLFMSKSHKKLSFPVLCSSVCPHSLSNLPGSPHFSTSVSSNTFFITSIISTILSQLFPSIVTSLVFSTFLLLV